MARTLHERNLDRLLRRVEEVGPSIRYPKGATEEDLGRRIARRVPLSHTTSDRHFLSIVTSGELLCQELLPPNPGGGMAQRRPTVEELLGTADSVFLFAGPFSFPERTYGFLWEAGLEKDAGIQGEASPFDSGGLVDVFTLPPSAGTPRQFLDRHRLGLARHRRYLEKKLAYFFEHASQYVTAPQGDGSINDPVVGLGRGDRRRWTHEVRIKERLPIRPHLLAVFLSRPAAFRHSSGVLQRWRAEGVRMVWYSEDDEGDFAAMQRECVEYIKGYLEI